ncbi:MAG: C40 family peptidase [Rhodobacterales bacterium]|nr:C40 family peptidase [Rhodobacterales bacterium]
MNWASRYVGIPFLDRGRTRAGCDCWGLARLIYSDELSIELPSYAEAYASAGETAELAALIDVERRGPWTPVDQIAAFDLLLFRRGAHQSHIGIAIGARAFIHMQSGDHAKVEPMTRPRFAGRFVGAFRHVCRPVEAPLKAVP